MNKPAKFALTTVMTCLLGLVPLLLAYASSPSRAQKPALTTADKWAEAVVDILTDPKLYGYTEQTLPPRLHNLVRLAPLPPPAYGVMEGSNPSQGIVFASVNFIGDGVQEVNFKMPATDAEGHPVFPALRSRLKRRLRAPLWTEYKDENGPEGPQFFWRRGNTKSVVDLFAGPSPNSEVLVLAAIEQGDSEE